MKVLFLALCIVCHLTGFVIFLKGFFPIKAAVPGHAQWTDHSIEPTGEALTGDVSFKNLSIGLPSQFRKYVFILIDALRADFVLPTSMSKLPKMEFVHRSILLHESHSFLAKAHPPTVTLPRIKAMTTGGIPGFVDVVLNLDSQSLQEDNIITQMKRAGKKIVFYGDDTWMRLFPDHFIRSDGTTSFFVTDYTQVDDNVTRHLEDELMGKDDWDVLILHYLGLDHIGHLAGPRSPLIKPKLKEMDHIVEKIYNTLKQRDAEVGQPSLVLVCGDHGMSDQGSHGGSSPTETAVPIVFLSSAWQDMKGSTYSDVQKYQIDLAPSLALLMGLPVPQNSLGTLLLPLIKGLSTREQLQRVYVNAIQIASVYKQYDAKYTKAEPYLMFQRAVNRHKNWLKLSVGHSTQKSNVDLNDLKEKTIDLYYKAMIGMREKIAASLSNYDMHAIGVGVLVLWMTLLAVWLIHLNESSETYEKSIGMNLTSTFTVSLVIEAVYIGSQIHLCTSVNKSELLCSSEVHSWVLNFVVGLTLWLFVNVVVQTVLRKSIKEPSEKQDTSEKGIIYLILRVGTVGHALTLLASSLIEEEHQTWYFLTLTINIVIAVTCSKNYFRTKIKSSLAHNDSHYSNIKLSDEKISERQNAQITQNVEEKFQQSYNVSKMRKGNAKNEWSTAQVSHSDKDLLQQQLHKVKMFEKRQYAKNIGSVILLLVLCRALRSWNSTGDKWSHMPDVGDWLVSPDNKMCLSLLTTVSLVTVLALKALTVGLHWRQHALFTAGVLYVYLFRAANGDLLLPFVYDPNVKSKGISEAKTIYFILLLMFINTMIQTAKTYNTSHTRAKHWNNSIENNKYCENRHKRNKSFIIASILKTYMLNIQTMWVVLMLLLVRPHNISLVVMEVFQVVLLNKALTRIKLDAVSLMLLYIWMANAAFFYQGNSNSITTVDVSAGYIGLETYQPVFVGVLLALATYAGPILWLLSLLIKISEVVISDVEEGLYVPSDRWYKDLASVVTTLQLTRCMPVAVYMVLVTLERYHLFVWTVFSPKLLYEGMHSLVIGVISLGILFMIIVVDKVNVQIT